MRILRNYILRDFFSSFFFSLMSLTVVMMLGNLIKVSDMIIRKGVAVIDALRIFSFFVPYILGFTIPLSILMAILLAMGRLIGDNELTAIHVAGISVLKILNIFLIIGTAFSLFLFILNDKVLPDFHYNYRWHIKNIYSKNIGAAIEPGVYLENFKDAILYVDDVKENQLKNVFIYEINGKGLSKLTYAKRGRFVVDNDLLKIELENGFRDEVNPKDKKEFYRLNFKIFFLDLPIQEKSSVPVEKKPSDMNMKELKEKIRRLEKIRINPIDFTAELHKRIALSFSPLTFVILGFGISLVVKHRERSINFGVAVLIAGIYYLLLLLGETLTDFHFVHPALGMWLANVTISLLGIFLIIKYAYTR